MNVPVSRGSFEVSRAVTWATVARLVAAGAIAIAIAAWLASSYAALVAPLHRAFGTVCGQAGGWRIDEVKIAAGTPVEGRRLTSIAAVDDPYTGSTGAMTVTGVTVGGVAQVPAVLLAIVCAWPVRRTRREVAWRLAFGVVALVVVELLATGLALQEGPAIAAAALRTGDPDATTVWTLWSRLMEGGGRLLLAATAGLAVVASGRALTLQSS